MVLKGSKMSIESREKMKISHLGKKGHLHTEETKEKLRQINLGKKLSTEQIKKMSERMKKNPINYWLGKKRSQETIKKISLAKTGTRLSDEAIRNIKQGQKNSIKFKEMLKKLVENNKGRKCSEEKRRKISEKQKGKIISLETRKKQSVAHKGNKSRFWRGGIYQPRRFDGFVWRNIRNKIFRRDKYSCQVCGRQGNKDIKMHVHHIVPYRITQDNSESNLITLCMSCHAKEELKYYKKLKQLEFTFGEF